MEQQSCYPKKAPKVDKMLYILENSIRREVIHFFETQDNNETSVIDDVVSYIEKRVPKESAKTLHRELRHNHLPKLAEHGWLNYNTSTGHIQYLGHDRAPHWLKQIRDMF